MVLIMQNNVRSLPKIYSGKVRDLYTIDQHTMLMVATDRLSTFDVILKQSIPNKGVYLTKIALFWFKFLQDVMPNHLMMNHAALQNLTQLLTPDELSTIKDRFMIVKKLTPIPIEVIVRGYLVGSAYKDYVANGAISGIKLPQGLSLASKLPEPIFTPSTKAQVGEHDENITISQCVDLIGTHLTNKITEVALKIYNLASQRALESGIIIADTKFEFGLDEDGALTLMDEVLTPDSSRFWDASSYKVGGNPVSFDKQFVRDYLELEVKWNKLPPIPDLPEEVIRQTSDKYKKILTLLGVN